jgi:hypothetical protein
MIRERLQRHAAFLLPTLFLPFAWWWPLLAGYLPDYMDTVTYLYPLRLAAAQQLRSGCLPLWLPNLFCGTPLAANPQLAAWYPPQLLFYLCPNTFGYGLLAILHYCLAGVGMYALVYHLGRQRGAAFLAALSFEFGSMMIGRIALMPHVYACAWVPWIFLTAEHARARPTRFSRRDITLAALLAMQLLAGAPQISYYSTLALSLLWFIRMVQIREYNWPAVRGIAIALLTLALYAIQLVPTFEFLSLVRRREIPIRDLVEQSLNGGFIWRSLVGFTIPGGEDIDSINAVGLVPCALALFGLLRRDIRSRALPYFLIAILSWFLSLGLFAPTLAKLLPGYTHFHAPRRALMLWSICIPVAAGLGFAALQMRSLSKASRMLVTMLALLSLASTTWILPRLERAFCRPTHLYPDQRYAAHIGPDRFVSLDPTLNYSYDSRRADYGKSLVPNGAPLAGLNDAQGYDPLMLENIARLRDVACRGSGILYPGHAVYFSNPLSPALRLMNVQYLVGRHDLYDPGRVVPGATIDHGALNSQLALVIEDDRWPLYRFRDSRKQAWCVARTINAADDPNALSNFWQSGAASEVALVAAGESAQASFQRRDVRVEWLTSRTIQLTAGSAQTAQSSFVCISDAYAPGWSAKDDHGRRLPVMCADGIILGLQLPPDANTVDLTYSPTSFLQGTLITAAALLLCAALWFRCAPPAPQRPVSSSGDR